MGELFSDWPGVALESVVREAVFSSLILFCKF